MVSTGDLLSAFDVEEISTEALLFQTGYLTITKEEELGGIAAVSAWAIRTGRCGKA